VAVFTLSRGKEAVLEYMDENGCTVPVLLDENGTVAAQFGVESVPRIFVIDQQGIIYTGYSGDRAGIRDALAKDIETLREKAEKSINKNKTRSQPRTDTLEKEYFR
jgi:AhpC/TSA family.